jgi:hypothetical protein
MDYHKKIHGLYELPENVGHYLSVIRTREQRQQNDNDMGLDSLWIGFGASIEGITPGLLTNARMLPLSSYCMGRIKIYTPPSGLSEGVMHIAPPLSTASNKRITVFYDEERENIERFYQTSPDKAARFVDLEALEKLKEIVPLTDERVEAFEKTEYFQNMP